MFAPGASAWTHSTSIDVSTTAELLAGGWDGSVLVALPNESTPTFLKNPEGSAMLNWESKACRSLTMFGSSYSLTMAIVCPVPSP